MKNFALVIGGLPIYTISSAVDAEHQDGDDYGGGVLRLCPDGVSHQDLVNNWYYSAGWAERPAIPGRFYIWDAVALSWVYDVAAARSAKAAEISGVCESSILAGFTSAALGVSHHYPSDMTDQANLTASVMRSTLTADGPAEIFPFKCADSAGEWVFRPHTAGQIQQVGKDAYQHILLLRQRNSELQALVAEATSEPEMNAIVW